MTRIAIIDYGFGNLRSVQKILEGLGVDAPISSEAKALEFADGLVLPGVGAFRDAMAKLNESGLSVVIREQAKEFGKPLLGICLGMQLLARDSMEGGSYEGLGLIDASVKPLQTKGKFDWAQRKLTLPHIGWNSVETIAETVLFDGIPSGEDFYFVHGYHVVCGDRSIVSATSSYGDEFVAAIAKDNIFATQFHPEKSQAAGKQLLANFSQAVSLRVAA